ncbi:MAG: deoxyribodipyrimidine photo-lyase [Deltaproteobacteria bacterium]|nr:MAG: deoxyribodipyrimidine photo-lyase [Deltaproteobacteria bacterium]
MTSTKALVWFRSDLRLNDNPALYHAIQKGYQIIPIFIWAPDEETPWAPGAASRVWLHQSLACLHQTLKDQGSQLILRHGPSLETLKKLIHETKAHAVFWNRRYEPAVIARDQEIKKSLKEDRIDTESFNGSLLFEPWEIKNKQGQPYQVFTAYWNFIQSLDFSRSPYPAPPLSSPTQFPKSESLESLNLIPKISLDRGIRHTWSPGEKQARLLLQKFKNAKIHDYTEMRDRPAIEGTSRLSPYLHFGEISPRHIWEELKHQKHSLPYLRQIVWREFSYYLLYQYPHTSTEPLRAEFKNFAWDTSSEASARFKKWQRGETGFAIVDAGMRELWETGWMHNRVRMIAASFLVKDLMIPWQHGAQWFWDTLVDADLANNTMGWQWVAGCGADASPFFRIFNPALQAKKFDPQNTYIQQWTHENTHPIVDHEIQRQKALSAYKQLKN